MVIANKKVLIEKLTGIHSSKKSYYVELKKNISEITRQNLQLEIINQLTKSIGVDMTFTQILENIIPKLQVLISFDMLNLYIIEQDRLVDQSTFLVENNHKPDEAIIKYNRQIEQLKIRGGRIGPALKKAIAEKGPLLRHCQDQSVSPEEKELQALGIASTILIPLMAKNKTVGVLELASKSNFNEQELPFLSQVADQLAVCLENVRLYKEVWQHKQEWETTFSAVTDLLMFINNNHEISRVNRAAIEFFTHREEEILGQKCYRLLYGRETKCNPCLADQVVKTGQTAYLQSRTRYHRVLDIFAYPAYTEQNTPLGVTYYAKDVTSFVDSIKFVSLGEMSAGVAHELNSPLTAIVGNSQLLLRETPLSDPHYQLIKDIKSCGMRCQRIIQNLLTFSRQDEYSFEEVNLNQVVERALSLVSYQIEKNKIEILKKLYASLPPVLGNAQGLEQIIINLMLNAKDAIDAKAEEGGNQKKGLITIKTRVQPEKFVAVDIIDTGCGIEAASIPHVFNPFYTTKRAGQGTGLGLSVSLGIAQAHRGFIDVDSIPGKGSRFSLIIPLDEPKPENSGANEETATGRPENK